MSEPKRTRLYFFGFVEEMVARTVLEVIKDAISKKTITVEDWAMVHKAPERVKHGPTLDPVPAGKAQ